MLGRETEGLVQSLNDRDQGTNGCWEWVREKFIILPDCVFLDFIKHGTCEGL